jgi:sugar phosphate isomerase/epimerase
MKISYFCTTWGQKRENWDAFFMKVRNAGYDGVETSLPPNEEEKEFLNGLAKYDLNFIGQHWETATSDFEAHKVEYARRLRALASLSPVSINAHTGKDYFSFERNMALLAIAAEITQETGIPITHETHRSRFAFAPHVTHKYLEHSHSLEITLDVSHWCAVAESLLQDQAAALNLALDRTRHIHARVGFPQGPQVPDFTLPQYETALQFHLECWDKIVDSHRKSDRKTLPITPEFGPPPYMQITSNGDAGEKQWKMNKDMMTLLKDRYSTSLR